MEFADVLAKVANNARLTGEEMGFLRRVGRETQERNAQVAGWSQVGRPDLNIRFPFAVIYSETLEVAVASITIQVPGDYRHLFIMGSMRTDFAAYNDTIGLRFNGDTGANYRTAYEGAQNTTQLAAQNATATYFGIGTSTGASATAGSHGNFFAFATNVYGSAWKSIISVSGTSEYSATDIVTLLNSGHWKNTAPVTSLTIFSANSANLIAGCILGVYGIL